MPKNSSKAVPVQPDYRAASRALIDEFPEFFEESFDVSLPAGWLQLARGLCSALRVVAPDVKVSQVKEKFGGARFYLKRRTSVEAQALIDEFEEQSFRVCDVCGAPGEPRTGGKWMRTRCEAHS